LVTAVKTTVVALIAMLVCSMGLAAPAGANVDQCAPPGVESASALPTNLAKAATGPGADKYTTATMDHGQVVESGPPEQIFEAAETDRLRRFLSQVL
jgi:hypothetical protein